MFQLKVRSYGICPSLPKARIFKGIYKVSFVSKTSFFFFLDFIYSFTERWEEMEKEGDKHQSVVAPWVTPTGGQACNPGMCPDWESNQQPFGSWVPQASTQSIEPHHPGQNIFIVYIILHLEMAISITFLINVKIKSSFSKSFGNKLKHWMNNFLLKWIWERKLFIATEITYI